MAEVPIKKYEELDFSEGEIVVPDKIASLVYSFVDSSTKKDYYWNKAYVKILPRGFWLIGVYKVNSYGDAGDASVRYIPFIRFVAGRKKLEIIYEESFLLLTANFPLERREFAMEDLRRFSLKGVRLERKVPLYLVLVKLLRYFNKIVKELNIST